MKTLIKNGTLITASDTFQADILVENEKIVQIGQALLVPDAKPVDASNKLILPGGVDAHTHFDLEMFDTVSSDDHYTGHKAAAFGGTTTVMDFVVHNPPLPEGEPPRSGREPAGARRPASKCRRQRFFSTLRVSVPQPST